MASQSLTAVTVSHSTAFETWDAVRRRADPDTGRDNLLFPTVTFAVFFTVVLAGNWWLMPRRRTWKLFMLAASYVFYGWWDARFVGLLAASALINHIFAVRIWAARTPARKRLALAAVISVNLGMLGWFKYAGFLSVAAAGITSRLGMDATPPLLEVILPVGISFFTFQALSYVIDVYRRDIVRPASLLDFAVYLSFFPQLVAGPIVRGTEMLPQLVEARDPGRIDAARGFHLILRGLFKKVVIATYLGTAITDGVFAAPAAHSSLEVLFGIYAYAIQIYADFSGYTDIAIGCAVLLGFSFPDNFDRPYAATSLRDFWRRWHMTLSRWLRDYLYIGLGGSRGPSWFTARNVMLTMLLGGLWHGAAWTFVIWGGIHGAALVAERAIRGRREDEPSLMPAWLKRIATFHVVCLAWVFFRADSFAGAWTVLGRLVTGWGPSPTVTPLLVAVIAGAIVAQLVPPAIGERVTVGFSRRSPAVQMMAVAAGLFVVSALQPAGVAPFIYFRF